MRGLIVAGTDTNIGKTVLSSLLMSSLPHACYWKPIQSGLLEETDTEIVARYSGCGTDRLIPESYRLSNPLSPHLSAQLDGITIDRQHLTPPTIDNLLIIETAGGVLVPLNNNLLQIELMAEWKLPVLLAARSTLGTINHTLMTLESLRARSIEVLGAVPIGPVNKENERAIEHFGNLEILGRIPMLDTISKESLQKVFANEFTPLSRVLHGDGLS